MFLNLTTLRSELGNRLKAPSTISSSRKDLWLNLAQDDVAVEMDPANLLVTDTFSSTSSTRKYYLDFQFNKIVAVVDTTNNSELDYLPESDVEWLNPDLSQTGTPSGWGIYGLEFIRAQPTSASVVTVVSSSASDTTQMVRINGIVSGARDTELLSLNGTTSVPGSKSFSSIHSIAVNSACVGRVTSTSNSGGVTLSVVAPGLFVDQKQPLYLWPIPDATISYRVRGYRAPRAMINAEDFPDMPDTYHELVLIGAIIRGHMDLFRHEIAGKVYALEWLPLVKKLKAEMGQRRSKRSPVIVGGPPTLPFGPRYPSNYPIGS